MNKAKLIQKVAERMDILSKAAKDVVDTVFDSMGESLKKGEGIEIRGFGSFVVRHYGSYERSYDKVTFEASKVWHEISCSKCNKRWADIYTLSDVEEID